MAEFDAGSVFTQIIPSFKGVQQSIDAESKKWGKSVQANLSDAIRKGITDGLDKGTKESQLPAKKDGDKTGSAFADSFKKRVEAALKSLPAVDINADTSKTDRKIQEIRKELQELSGKTIGVDIDAGAADSRIRELTAELDKLGAKSPNIQVKVDTAAATAQLAAFTAEADLASGASGGGGLAGLAAAAPSLSPLTTAMIVFGSAAIPILAVVTAGAGALVAGLAGAVLGAAALAAVVIPAFQRITKGNKAIASAQKKVASAAVAQSKAEQGVNDAKTLGGKASATARLKTATQNLATAQKNLSDASASLTPAETALSDALNGTKAAFTGWTQALEPTVLPLVAEALGLVNPLLKALTPLVVQAAAGFGSFLADLQAFVQSPWFASFIQTLGGLAEEAIPVFGGALLSLVKAFGGLVTAFAPVAAQVLPGLADLATKFATWATNLAGSKGFQDFLAYVKANAPAVGTFLKNVAGAFANIITAVAPIGAVVLPILSSIFGVISKIPTWILTALAAAIIGVALALGIATIAVAIFEAVSSPVTLVIAAIIAVIGLLVLGIFELVTHWTQIWNSIRTTIISVMLSIASFLSTTWTNIKLFFSITWAGIVRIFSGAWNNIKLTASLIWNSIHSFFVSKLALFKSVWSTAWNAVGHFFSVLWTNIRNNAVSVWNSVAGFFSTRLHNFITNWEAVWHTVSSAFQSAWNGIKSVVSKIWGDIQGFVTKGVNGIIGVINTLLSGINTVAHFFGLKSVNLHINPIGQASPKQSPANGGAGKLKHLATGGLLRGPGSGVSDSILGLSAKGMPTARVSNGEYVVNAKSTARFLPLLQSLNRAGLPGHAQGGQVGGLPGFSLGGVIGSIGHFFGDAASWVGQTASGMFGHVSGAINSALGDSWAKGIGTGMIHKVIGWALSKLGPLSAKQGTGGVNSVPAKSGSARAAQSFAAAHLAQFGWGSSQMPPLISLWNQESGWNANAVNKSSGAYGIPQSLGHGHPYNLGDYANQVLWGLNYIKGRYGSPSAAWAHEVSHNWYSQGGPVQSQLFDTGGWLMPGATMAVNGTGKPERILTHQQWGSISGALANRGDGFTLHQEIYPSQGMSEMDLANDAHRRAKFAMR